mgnify:CR=1 FL=1
MKLTRKALKKLILKEIKASIKDNNIDYIDYTRGSADTGYQAPMSDLDYAELRAEDPTEVEEDYYEYTSKIGPDDKSVISKLVGAIEL